MARQQEREDLLSFFDNISDHHLIEFFNIIHEIKNVLEFETKSEELTFQCFSGVLWKATAGLTMLKEGRSRKTLEEFDEELKED
jgi:hypothetical protein